MAVRGIGTYFALGSAASPGSPDDISSYLNDVAPSGDVERLDATTFQPDVANPVKTEINGFTTKGFSLTGIWTPAADDFFSDIVGSQDVEYEFGPQGHTAGDVKISGLCNVLSYVLTNVNVGAVTGFQVELSVTSEARSTFS
jgi:hypothetical protein